MSSILWSGQIENRRFRLVQKDTGTSVLEENRGPDAMDVPRWDVPETCSPTVIAILMMTYKAT
jgi:hypothetical protein